MAALNGTRTGAETETQGPSVRDGEDWVELLSTPGPARDDALRQLHALLIRAARHQIGQMPASIRQLGGVRVDDIVNQAADEALVTLLGKLSTFEGRSRFTTWAYKFAIFHTAVEVRRTVWRNREVPLEYLPHPQAEDASPEQFAEASAFSAAVGAAIDATLTAHQRRVVLALLVDDVPIDVLAERLGTTRNALYKTLHDARGRLRRHLTVAGYLAASEVTS